MHKIAFAAGLLALLAATPAAAQHRDHPADMDAHLAQLQEALDLTGAQAEQVRVIFTEQHEKAERLHEETHARVMAVLTDEQRGRLEEFHEEHGAGHSCNGGERKHGQHRR